MARDTFARGDWGAAFEAFQAAQALGDLSADDWFALGDSAWWLGLVDESLNAWEEAYRLYLRGAQPRRAAMSAMFLAGHSSERLVQSPRALVSLELHRRLLRRFVQPGWRVLEVGAGPGRFTIELATMGTTIVVSDVSTVQLQLNAQKARAAGCESAVEERRVLDVRDLSEVPDRSFDRSACSNAYETRYSAPVICATRPPMLIAVECSAGTRCSSTGVVRGRTWTLAALPRLGGRTCPGAGSPRRRNAHPVRGRSA